MAAFTYVRGLGLWVADSVVTPTEFETIEARWPKILHSDGGTWSQAADIDLTGTGCINHAGTTKWPKVGSRTVTVNRPLIPYKLGTYWNSGAMATSPNFNYVTSTASSSDDLNGKARFILPPLPAGTLTSLVFRLKGEASHSGGSLPLHMPRIDLWQMTTGDMINVIYDDTVVDSASTGTAYALDHSVTLTLATPRSTDGTFMIDVRNEWGTSVFFPLTFCGFFQANITITEVKAQ